MQLNPLLIEAYDFLETSGFFEDKNALDWIQKLNTMYDRGWLYASMRGDELLAVAGAFRVPAWDPKYLSEPPERDEGEVLFISFFSNNQGDHSIPLKLLKYFLKQHRGIKEVVFYRKKWSVQERRFHLEPYHQNTASLLSRSGTGVRKQSRRIIVAPPEMVPMAQLLDPHSKRLFQGVQEFSFCI